MRYLGNKIKTFKLLILIECKTMVSLTEERFIHALN